MINEKEVKKSSQKKVEEVYEKVYNFLIRCEWEVFKLAVKVTTASDAVVYLDNIFDEEKMSLSAGTYVYGQYVPDDSIVVFILGRDWDDDIDYEGMHWGIIEIEEDGEFREEVVRKPTHPDYDPDDPEANILSQEDRWIDLIDCNYNDLFVIDYDFIYEQIEEKIKNN